MDNEIRINVPKLDKTETRDRILLKRFPRMKIKNKGRWGYTKEDAIIIESEDKGFDFHAEKMFIQFRTEKELSAYAPKNEEMSILGIDFIKETRINEGGKYFNVFYVEISCVKTKEYLAILHDLKSFHDQDGDIKGDEEFKKLCESITFRYDRECWFDITNFYNGDQMPSPQASQK